MEQNKNFETKNRIKDKILFPEVEQKVANYALNNQKAGRKNLVNFFQ